MNERECYNRVSHLDRTKHSHYRLVSVTRYTWLFWTVEALACHPLADLHGSSRCERTRVALACLWSTRLPVWTQPDTYICALRGRAYISPRGRKRCDESGTGKCQSKLGGCIREMFVRANSACPPVHGFWYRAIVRAFRRCILLGLAGCCSAVAVAVDGSTMQPNAAHVAISTAVPRILVSAQSAECACDLTKERESLDLSKIDRGLCLSLIYTYGGKTASNRNLSALLSVLLYRNWFYVRV